MRQIEKKYEDFINEVSDDLQKVDPVLILETLYFERKSPDIKPALDLRVLYSNTTNLERKQIELNTMFGCATTTYLKKYHGITDYHRTIKITCTGGLETLRKLSMDPDVVHVIGKASLFSYGCM